MNLPLVFGIMGFLFSTRTWLLFVNQLNPFIGLAMYYVIMVLIVILLEYFGLIISGIKINSISQTIGAILIVFAFFITMDWQSCYARAIQNDPCLKEITFFQTEAGMVYYLWSKLFTNQDILRFLTFVITPISLALIGTFLINEKVFISPFALRSKTKFK